MTTFDFSRIAYPSYMDLTESASSRRDLWEAAGYPPHGFTPALPDSALCVYCSRPPGSRASHSVGALAATYGPRPVAASIRAAVSQRHGDAGPCTPGDRCVPGGPGVGYKCDAHLPPARLAGVIAGMDHLAEQVHGIRLDAGTVVIAGETYVRRPF